MAHQVCHDIGAWTDTTATEPLEKCVEQDCNWWCLCCNKWFCFIVWVVVQVVKWVVTTVCEIVADVVDLVVAVVLGIVEIIIGVFTWDWARVWDGLVGIAAAAAKLVWDIVRTFTLGSLIGTFRDRANAWSLRNYVRDLIDGRRGYSDEDRRRIKDALGITGSGGFGLRLRYTAFRGFVRSDQTTGEGGVPDLVAWNNDTDENTRVDLKILAGINWTTFWQRGRPELDPSQSESDIDAYLANPSGTDPFTIFAMSNGVLDDKLGEAVVKGSQLGLILRFDKQDVQLRRPEHVRMSPSNGGTAGLLRSAPFNRTPGAVDMAAAQADLCMPITLASFLYTDNTFTGFSANLGPSTCLDGSAFDANDLTGCTFRDRLPDLAFRYVPIHEIGHTFGLCHVDGAHRIMLSTKQKSFFDWPTIPEFWLSGGPIFILDEAKKTWDYVIANFSVECLATRQF
jgi:hypothetical protein